jgi:hypothetical protein
MADIIIQTYKQHPNWVTAGLAVAGITGGLLGVSGISLIISSGVSMPGLNAIRDALTPWGEGLAGGGALLTGGFILGGTLFTGIKICRYKDPIYMPADDVDEIDNTTGDPSTVFKEWQKKISNPSADAIKLTQNALNALTYIILNSKKEKIIILGTLGTLKSLQDEAYTTMKKQGSIQQEAIRSSEAFEKTPDTLDITDEKQREIVKQIAYAQAYGWTKSAGISKQQQSKQNCIAKANGYLKWINDNFNEQTPTLTDENVAETLRSLEDQEPMKTAKQLVNEDDLEGEDRD